MPRYYWQDTDAVAHLDVRDQLRNRYAMVHLRQGADDAVQDSLTASLQARGYTVIAAAVDGQPVLRVRGFKKQSDLFDALQDLNVVSSSQPTREEAFPEEQHKEAKDWRTFLKERSIQMAGATYLIADMMPVLAGRVLKDNKKVSQGLKWGATSVMLLLFGRKNPDRQMGNIYRKMQDYFALEGIDLPDDATVAMDQLKTNPSYLNTFINFIYDHPILINNTFQGWGGVDQLRSGLNPPEGRPNHYYAVAGASVATGMWGGLIIPENKFAGKSKEEQQELKRRESLGEEVEGGFETGFFDNPVTWIHEKPLRLSAIGPIIGNVLTGLSVFWDDRHRVNTHFGIESKCREWNPTVWAKDYSRSAEDLLRHSGLNPSDPKTEEMLRMYKGSRFTAMSPFFNIAANVLYGMSSKEERSVDLDKEGYIDELLDVAANVYVQVPTERRPEKLLHFAGFLKSQPDVNIDERDIKQRIEAKIEALQSVGKNPASEEERPTNKLEEKPDWVGKVGNDNKDLAPAAGV